MSTDLTPADLDRIERDGTEQERALVAALRKATADALRLGQERIGARMRADAAEAALRSGDAKSALDYFEGLHHDEQQRNIARIKPAEAEAAEQAATISYIQADLLAARAEADKLKTALQEIAGYTSSEWARKAALAALEAK